MLHEIGLDFYAIQAARTKRLHWRGVLTDFLMKIDLESGFSFFHIIVIEIVYVPTSFA